MGIRQPTVLDRGFRFASGSSLLNTNSPFARKLKGFWPMTEGIGSTLNDYSIFDNHGTIPSGVTWVDNDDRKALSFDGSSLVNVGTRLSVNTAETAVSVAAWVKTSTTGSNDDAVGMWSDGTGPDFRRFHLYKDSSEHMTFRVYNGTSIVSDTGTTVVSDGAWHRVWGTWDNAVVRIWVDGDEDGSGTALAGGSIPGGQTTDVRIGHVEKVSNDTGRYWNGEICNVGFWGRLVTPDEIGADFLEQDDLLIPAFGRFLGTTAGVSGLGEGQGRIIANQTDIFLAQRVVAY